MKRASVLACARAIALALALAVPGFADPVEGCWISIDDKSGAITAGWEIYQQGGVLYGRILSIANFPQDTPALLCKESYPDFPVSGKVNEMPVVGTIWIYGLRRDREGQWSGGRIIDPNNGRLYGCKISFHPAGSRRGGAGERQGDSLEIRGTLGPFGASQFWRKSSAAEAASLR